MIYLESSSLFELPSNFEFIWLYFEQIAQTFRGHFRTLPLSLLRSVSTFFPSFPRGDTNTAKDGGTVVGK